jgi:hypothetical protein
MIVNITIFDKNDGEYYHFLIMMANITIFDNYDGEYYHV